MAEHPYVTIDELGLRNAPILYGNIASFAHLMNEKSRFKEFFDAKAKILPDGMIYADSIDSPQKIFFVIGESSARSNYSLYGYSQNTTPRLDAIQKSDSSFRYYNGMASAGLTRDVLRLTLTHAIPNKLDRFYKYKTIIDFANDAGYETIWIAQSPQLGFDSDAYINAINSAVSKTQINNSLLDITLLPLVKELNKSNKKQFILIHLSGSHIEYPSRYDELDKQAISGKYDELEYDRTIHHTDRVLKEFYNICMQDSSSLLLYYSDHGEEINRGHGFKTGKNQFKVPFIIANNSKLNIDSIVDKYKYQQDSQDVVGMISSYLITAEILGYIPSEANVQESIESSKHIYHPDGQIELYVNVKD